MGIVMSKSHSSKNTFRLAPAIALCSLSLLAACSSADVLSGTDYETSAYNHRYPIEVKKAPVKMGVAAKSGTLQPDQINAVASFAQDARENAASRVYIRYPSASGKSRAAASNIAELMVNQGVPAGAISVGSYKGSASSPIQLSYERKVAVTKECGDWSDNMAYTEQNTAYLNHGCATQNNLAAMVANPEDFERPRPMSPVVAANRVAAMDIYFEGQTDSSSASTASSSSSSTTTGTTLSN